MLPQLRHLLKHLFPIVTALAAAAYLLLDHWGTRPDSMSSSPSAQEVATALLAEHGLRLQSLKVIQSLWAGYGQICYLEATPDSSFKISADSSRSASAANSNVNTPQEKQTYILKLITPPPTKSNNEGHTRKILSYQVEQYFYTQLASQLPPSLPVAKCLSSINQHHADNTSTTAMIMTNLKENFPVAGEKRNVLSSTQVNAALDWLSGFHGFWWSRVNDFDRKLLVRPPLEEVKQDGQDAVNKSVWLNGGYTYLATRRKEYKDLANDHHSEWSEVLTRKNTDHGGHSIAEMVARLLAPNASQRSPISAYETLIHGDVKSENLFTSQSGEQVAFYDFQYTGLGLGVCDLAKLFTCSVPLSLLVERTRDLPHDLRMQDGEKQLLERYWVNLRNTGGKEYKWETFVFHWEVALVDWLRFQASWGFWGNTEWLEARVRSILHDSKWRDTLLDEISKA